MRKINVLAMVLLVAAVLALPGAAQSAMWVGGELGANFVSSPSIDVNGFAGGTVTANSVKIEPSVIGGITLGYDFVNTGFGAYAWPDWMKYFSFATDFTYNRMDIRNQNSTITQGNVSFTNQFPFVFGTNSQNRTEGYIAAWTFLFMGHYGFLPDSEVPAGRLHPYIGVGPAVVFSGLNLKSLGNASQTNIALVTEGGLRFMALKNVSLDLAFRYRFFSPSYSYTDNGNFTGIPGNNVKVSFDANAFSVLTRVSYHF